MNQALAKAVWRAKVTSYQSAPPEIVPELCICEPKSWTPLRIEPPLPPDIKLPPDASSVRGIGRTVAQYYGIPFAVFVGPSRRKCICQPRQVAMYLAHVILHRSYPHIARRLGRLDHTTALWAIRKITRLLGEDAELARQIEEIKQILQGE